MKLSSVELRHLALYNLNYPFDHFEGIVQDGPKGAHILELSIPLSNQMLERTNKYE